MNIEIQSSIVESSIVEWSLSEESPPPHSDRSGAQAYPSVGLRPGPLT